VFVFTIFLLLCSVVIINYLSNYATLGHLVDSVKPGGKLTNTIAEIGIHVINGKKKKGATRWVMPLYITVSFLFFFGSNNNIFAFPLFFMDWTSSHITEPNDRHSCKVNKFTQARSNMHSQKVKTI